MTTNATEKTPIQLLEAAIDEINRSDEEWATDYFVAGHARNPEEAQRSVPVHRFALAEIIVTRHLIDVTRELEAGDIRRGKAMEILAKTVTHPTALAMCMEHMSRSKNAGFFVDTPQMSEREAKTEFFYTETRRQMERVGDEALVIAHVRAMAQKRFCRPEPENAVRELRRGIYEISRLQMKFPTMASAIASEAQRFTRERAPDTWAKLVAWRGYLATRHDWKVAQQARDEAAIPGLAEKLAIRLGAIWESGTAGCGRLIERRLTQLLAAHPQGHRKLLEKFSEGNEMHTSMTGEEVGDDSEIHSMLEIASKLGRLAEGKMYIPKVLVGALQGVVEQDLAKLGYEKKTTDAVGPGASS